MGGWSFQGSFHFLLSKPPPFWGVEEGLKSGLLCRREGLFFGYG